MDESREKLELRGELGHGESGLADAGVYRSGVPRRDALMTVALAVILIGPSLWIGIRNWPPTGFGATLLLGGVAFDIFLIWDVFLAPASEVRVETDRIELHSSVKHDSVGLAELTYAKPDFGGRPEIGWKTGRRKLNVRGQQLQALLDDLRQRNPAFKVSGLKGS